VQPFELTITPSPVDIDELGHVNNAVWVRWLQDVAVAHWTALAAPADIERYIWVVLRHEVDYRGNVSAGETVTARTWVPEPPRGARFDRHVAFSGPDGKVKVQAKTTWAMVERATGRVQRVPREMVERFLG
jgi:acyl-CoA thioester hydrolase